MAQAEEPLAGCHAGEHPSNAVHRQQPRPPWPQLQPQPHALAAAQRQRLLAEHDAGVGNFRGPSGAGGWSGPGRAWGLRAGLAVPRHQRGGCEGVRDLLQLHQGLAGSRRGCLARR